MISLYTEPCSWEEFTCSDTLVDSSNPHLRSIEQGTAIFEILSKIFLPCGWTGKGLLCPEGRETIHGLVEAFSIAHAHPHFFETIKETSRHASIRKYLPHVAMLINTPVTLWWCIIPVICLSSHGVQCKDIWGLNGHRHDLREQSIEVSILQLSYSYSFAIFILASHILLSASPHPVLVSSKGKGVSQPKQVLEEHFTAQLAGS